MNYMKKLLCKLLGHKKQNIQYFKPIADALDYLFQAIGKKYEGPTGWCKRCGEEL